MKKGPTVQDVKEFWENNPLFKDESRFIPGTKEYYEEHKKVYIEDCFAGRIPQKIFPNGGLDQHVLDLGCGPGFWTTEILLRGDIDKIVASDLTSTALQLCEKRLKIYNLLNDKVEFIQANAEKLPFEDESFTHVNCQGVIHHTPNTQKCIEEINRVLKKDGTAIISVYYKNIILRNWGKFSYLSRILGKFGAKLHGRGREGIFSLKDPDEIVRLYDGNQNPIGKCYDKKEFIDILYPYFKVDEIFYHFFPARSLPINIPKRLHRYLDRNIPFMIFAKITK